VTDHLGTESNAGQTGARFGDYTLLRKLGQGGMAEIYLAIKPSLGGIQKIVVLKRIRADQAGNKDLIKMFLEEARIASTLSHPNICQIHDVGEVGGRHYLAMEYLHGEDVRAVCRKLARMRRPLPIEHSLAIVAQTASGLHYAHSRTDLQGRPLKIVHRDVSPQNMFVTFDGTVKLLDFGIAKAENRVGGVETVSGVIKGKLTYMSPEQVQGMPLAQSSDVYALGIVLWELTTGRRLFKADTDYKVLKKIVDDPVPTPRSVWPDYYPELERVVMKALARDVTQRYQTAREMQADLTAFARRESLLSGDAELSTFMQDVFADRLEEERQARESGRELYEVLRDREWSDSGASEEAGTGPGARGRDTGPSGVRAMALPAPAADADGPELPEPTKVTAASGASVVGADGRARAGAGAGTGADAKKSSTLLVVALVGLGILVAVGALGFVFLGTGDEGSPDETGRTVKARGDEADDEARGVHAVKKDLSAGKSDEGRHGESPATAGERPATADDAVAAGSGAPESSATATAATAATAESTAASTGVKTGKVGKGPKKTPAAKTPPSTASGIGSDLEDPFGGK
jgi:serine/threonine protein kinase